MERDCMEFDVLIVGGPGGFVCCLSRQTVGNGKAQEISVCARERFGWGAHSLARCLKRAVWMSCFRIERKGRAAQYQSQSR